MRRKTLCKVFFPPTATCAEVVRFLVERDLTWELKFTLTLQWVAYIL